MTWQSDHRETEYDFKLLNLIMHLYATMLDVNLTKYVHINVNFFDKEMWVCTTVCVTAACTRQTFYALMSHVRLHVQSPLTDGIKHLSVPWKLTIHSTHSHMYADDLLLGSWKALLLRTKALLVNCRGTRLNQHSSFLNVIHTSTATCQV